jgi:hypothetical protein
MKKLIVLFLVFCAATFAMAQKVSPEAKGKGKIGDVDITIKYSRPSVKGRKIFGELVPYDKVWRTGADSATTIEFSRDVKIEGQNLPAGKYALFTIPTNKGEWTFIFNKKTDQWGAFNYDAKDDALRVTIKSIVAFVPYEELTFLIGPTAVVLAWEEVAAAFGVE